MSLFGFLKKSKEESQPKSPAMLPKTPPQTALEYYQQGWLFYAAGIYDKAIDYYHYALQNDPHNLDTFYALALALKADGNKSQAIENFKKALSLVPTLEEPARTMLSQMIQGHIHHIESGTWDPHRKEE